MNREKALAVWAVLATYCGAPTHLEVYFLDTAMSGRLTEFRFCGALGFGGKYYADNRVSCYPEDRNPEREEMLEKANMALGAIE